MNDVNAYGTLLIESNKDIDRYYDIIHNKYLSKLTKPSVELREWMCLISFLQKNKTKKCNVIRLQYPFTVQKNESPDFLIFMKNKVVKIEIAKITSKNHEALITLSYKKHLSRYEDDSRLYDNETKMTKKELLRLFLKKGVHWVGNGLSGDYKEKKWGEI